MNDTPLVRILQRISDLQRDLPGVLERQRAFGRLALSLYGIAPRRIRRPGEKICAFCGRRRNVEVRHLDGREENSRPENLIWNCRACNTRLGLVFKRPGILFGPTRGDGSDGRSTN
jgi:hypothetical protein